jgi:hypothetical protein
MKAAEKDPTASRVALNELTTLFGSGEPSLRGSTTAPMVERVELAMGEFVDAQGKSFVLSDPPPATGGKYGDYIYNAKGIDLRQQVEKLLYGALFFRTASSLLAGPASVAQVDKILALFGANPALLGDDKAPENADLLAALYAERRDKKDASKPGIYLRFKAAAIRAQDRAARTDAACQSEAQLDVKEMMNLWEQAIDATCIYYMKDAAPKFDSADDVVRSSGFHAYGEVVAFLEGFKGLTAKKTDADIQQGLTLIEYAPEVRSYSVFLKPAMVTQTFQPLIDSLAKIHQFTADDLATFGKNY